MQKTALVIGSTGFLGRAVVKALSDSAWTGARLLHVTDDSSSLKCPARASSPFPFLATPDLTSTSSPFRVVISCAGGFIPSGDDISVSHSIALSDKMMQMNLHSGLNAVSLARNHRAKGLVLVGSRAVYEAAVIPLNMLHYGLAKDAVHRLAVTVGEHTDLSVLLVLPSTMDTLTNRQAMPNADPSKWVKPETIALDVEKWASQLDGKKQPLQILKH